MADGASQASDIGSLQQRPPAPAFPVQPALAPREPPTSSEAPPKRKFGSLGFHPPRPAFRVTSEYDSGSQVFFQRVSCALFDRLAKFRLSFLHNRKGEVSSPLLRFNYGKRLSVDYDVESRNALIKGSFDVSDKLQIQASRDWKEQQGEITVVAKLPEPSYKVALTSSIPAVGLPRAIFHFPGGEVSIEEKEDDKADRVLSVNGILRGQVLSGLGTAQYEDANLKTGSGGKNLKLRYSYKDKEMTLTPEISLPYNALSLMFKRRFSFSDKLSYCYHFHSSDWYTVYKHTFGDDLKLKVGYDSEVRLAWASLWVGDEVGKTKTAPMKMKVQFMLQVPQDEIEKSALMFRVKKRWDF